MAETPVNWETKKAEDGRLVILRELAAQSDRRLNDTLISEVLATFGHNRTRDWVRTQLRALADLGAVTLTEAGTVMIASLTRAGLDHAEGRAILEGVRRPSPEA